MMTECVTAPLPSRSTPRSIGPVVTACGREHHVAAGDFVDAVFAVGVGDAHAARALDLALVLEQQAALHLGVDAAERRRRDHPPPARTPEPR